MPFDADQDAAGPALATGITHLSIHTADPGTTGASLAAPKVAVTPVYDDGEVTLGGVPFDANASASYAITHHGYWRGATFVRGKALAAPIAVPTGHYYDAPANAVVIPIEDAS